MGFFGQEHWGGLSCPPPGDLPQPGIEPVTVSPPALVGSSFTTSATWETPVCSYQSSSVQSCPTLCDPIDCSMPGFPVRHQLLELPHTPVH